MCIRDRASVALFLNGSAAFRVGVIVLANLAELDFGENFQMVVPDGVAQLIEAVHADAVGIPADNESDAVGLFTVAGAVVEQHADDFVALVPVSYTHLDVYKRQDLADWNAGKIPVAVTQPASTGHGLNLQHGGSTIVWFGLNWSLELYEQANARLWRQGQKETVVIHHLVVKGTMDEQVMRALHEKAADQNALLAAVKARIQEVK